MAWHLLEKLVEHSAAHSTILGKWWIGIVFIFRIIVVASIGEQVYEDEQDEFVCNTKQPGCKQVCYNYFAPISHIRFWAFQIIVTGTPSLIFIIYATHKLNRIPPKLKEEKTKKSVGTSTSSSGYKSLYKFISYQNVGQEASRASSSKHDYLDGALKEERAPIAESSQQNECCREEKIKRSKTHILKSYVASLLLRTLLEGGCIYLQCKLFKLTVPTKYQCTHDPCPHTVDCFVSRPIEKTIFLFFMLGVAAACCLINFIELGFLMWKRLKWNRRASRNNHYPGIYRGSHLSKNNSGDPQELREKASCPMEDPPPGYYIPDVDPPTEKYCSPANGFPPIRMAAASFTTSESDVTSDDATSMGSMIHVMDDNARRFL